MLAVEHLSGPASGPVIHDITLALPAGATHVVLGPIHSGKSMVMRHIVGLERAARGRVSICGESFDAADPREPLLRRLRIHFGVLFEGSALFTRLSVLENVELPLLEHTDASAREAREAAHALLADVGLAVAEEAFPGELSRADQRRVALARALALRPSVVLLDEPTHGLDSHSAAELDATLARLQRMGGFGVLIFTHEVRYAFGRTDCISVMQEGRIVAEGTRDELRESDVEIVRQLLNRREHS